ncbi:Hsp90 cochaperone [Malassezia vespertilionis]|uniref:Hsp90 cochaperone n=1 Tax=Malassezia vespertilionis TaxID=2020962 RepID=UPI0024B0FA64|nr:Hsp90 cochaperone [Malassezia vespertilionis]WFD08035.1 Hsp90 cochaperone [Malassezia vespertilionis]
MSKTHRTRVQAMLADEAVPSAGVEALQETRAVPEEAPVRKRKDTESDTVALEPKRSRTSPPVDMEWEEFQRTVLTPSAAPPAKAYDYAVISAEPELLRDPAAANEAREAEAPETEEEQRARMERAARQDILERIELEQRAQDDADERMSVAELKAQGNASFAAKDYENAIKHYTSAIDAANQSGEKDGLHVLYSNRSASHAGLKHWDEALKDADKTIEANPNFAKGYGRKGSALHGAHKYDEAVAAYKQGLEKVPEDAGLKKGLADVERAQSPSMDPFGAMFKDPQLFAKLAMSPKTKPYLDDPSYVQKLQELQSGAANPMTVLQDQRMVETMGVLMGVDMQAFQRPEDVPDVAKPAETPKAAPPAETPEEPMPETNVDAKVDTGEAKARADADAQKKLGNEHYLKRDFAAAAEHYKKAWELCKDITYLNNLGAVYFEEGKYDECIKTCEEAVEQGRSMRADYKLVAKAFGRIGSAYLKKDDLDKAIFYFEKSLTEHRTPDVLERLRSTERAKRDRARAAYIDPAKAEEERTRGNALFKEGDFPGSVQAYTEAIRRNPDDPRGYTNRASAYTKLTALPEALKDADEAIKVDPNFVKAYIRKSNVLYAMKEYTKALEVTQRAADVDNAQEGGAQHQHEIQGQTSKCMQALYSQRSTESEEETLQRAMRDPEVASILQDPVMQSILQQAQSDPGALQDHMKNTAIRAKIQKLIAAGIIRTR